MTETCWPQFRIIETPDPDGAVRLKLLGELDIAVVDDLTLRLDHLRARRKKVRVDLSRLEFIDGRGFAAILHAVWAGRMPDGDLDARRRARGATSS